MECRGHTGRFYQAGKIVRPAPADDDWSIFLEEWFRQTVSQLQTCAESKFMVFGSVRLRRGLIQAIRVCDPTRSSQGETGS